MSRYIVYGAGAIGGTVGATLFLHQREVVLIARGRHREVIEAEGLRFETPSGAHLLKVPIVGHPSEIDFRDGDVALLTMKLQDSRDALDALSASAPPEIPVVCMQNGVAGERMALRTFENVYGCLVVCPAEYLEPGLVLARGMPKVGFFDIGRYPSGVDETAIAMAAELNDSGLTSRTRDNIMAWKYAKLVRNLTNSVQAIVAGQAGDADKAIETMLRDEAAAVYKAAGIVPTSDQDFAAATPRTIGEIPGRPSGGSSSWQSFARGTGSVESDYLNGEIALLGRLHGVPTPGNALLQHLSSELARTQAGPGAITMDEFLTQLDAAKSR